MDQMNGTNMIKFREAIKKFLIYRICERIDDGEFDPVIKSFLEGDSISIDLSVNFIPNDIIFMRILMGDTIPSDVAVKVAELRKSLYADS